jgi:hypothetical protein
MLRVTKYLGEVRNVSVPFPFVILPNEGIVPESSCAQDISENPAEPPRPSGTPPQQPGKPISFSSVIKFPQ